MNILCKIFFGALLAVLVAGCACTSAKERKVVSQRGAKDANELVERAPSMSQMQIESYLLRIRANEYEYRQEGKNEIADAYIESFERTLAESGDSLAASILDIEDGE